MADNSKDNPPAKQQAPVRRWWKLIVVALAGLLVLFLLWIADWGRYREYCFCTHCGMHMTATYYQIPLTEISLKERDELEPTTLSTAMVKHRFIGQHTHNWKVAYGCGNTIRCVYGGHVKLAIYSRTNTPYLNLFTRMLVDYRGRAVTERWCTRLLSMDSKSPTDEPMNLPVPFMRLSREEFDAFVSDHGDELLLNK